VTLCDSTLQKIFINYYELGCQFGDANFVDEVDVVVQGLYDIPITTNKFCIAKMYSCMCGVFILKKPSQTEIGKIASKISKNLFFFFAL
jgi:hypothetical protein